ncbi:uncharacterized protein [Parasteatoda tepidariorum]|uniref:uncharacterized protein n=1 Tax=Parasteatoda tepidariorum TaxID=114398 RepID=UPI0039BD4023
MKHIKRILLIFKKRCWNTVVLMLTFFGDAVWSFESSTSCYESGSILSYITITSACISTYRSNRIKPGTIAMVPITGYIKKTNHSADAMLWLDFTALKEKKTKYIILSVMQEEKRLKAFLLIGFAQTHKPFINTTGAFTTDAINSMMEMFYILLKESPWQLSSKRHKKHLNGYVRRVLK